MIKDHFFITEKTKGSPKITPDVFVEYDKETSFFQFHIIESAKPRLQKEAKERGFVSINKMIINDCKQHANDINAEKKMTCA